MKEVIIYTDGGAKGNPGPGGWGAVLMYGEAHRKEMSGGFKLTTNNRMELTAAIEALAVLNQPCKVTLHSDSKYVVDGMSKGWAKRWRSNGWKRNKKEMAQNPDLWGRLLDEAARHQVRFQWVKGHAGIEENERCDELAVTAADQPGLPADPGYKG